MSIVPMRKLSLYVHNDSREAVLTGLQKLGILHLSPVRLPEGSDLPLSGVTLSSEEIDLYLADIGEALDFYSEFTVPVRTGALKAAGAGLPAFSLKKMRDIYTDFDLVQALEDIKKLERDFRHQTNTAATLSRELAEVSRWKDAEIDLDILNGKSERLSAVTGAVPLENSAGFAEELRTRTPFADARLAFETAQDAFYCIIFLKTDRKTVLDFLRERAFLETSVTQRTGSVDGVVRDVEKELREAENRIKRVRSEIADSLSCLNTLKIISDYLTVLKSRVEAQQKGVETDTVSFYNGYFPGKREKDLVVFLDRQPGVDYSVGNPSDTDEVPIELKVAPPVSPFEVITRMYGLPVYGKTVDPTAHLSLFYFIFYGFCLSDFFYGLIMLVAFGLVALKVRKNRDVSRFLSFLAVVGFSTMIFGVLFGSYFGDLLTTYLPRYFPALKGMAGSLKSLMLTDPLKYPLVVMYYALLLGSVQLVYGIILRMATAFRDGVVNALLDNVPWILLLTGGFGVFVLAGIPSLAPMLPRLPESVVRVLMYFVLAGAAGVIVNSIRKSKNPVAGFFGGLYGLYGVTSFLGDLLSYARLLALGVGTGVISMVFNYITFMVVGDRPNILTVFFGLLIFLVGHAFNLVMSAFGAFIHSARLQYVEFFSKFYSAGGQAFRPLREEGRYHDIQSDESGQDPAVHQCKIGG